jgi:hypothetical protein
VYVEEMKVLKKCFPSNYNSHPDAGKKMLLTQCIRDIMPFLAFSEFLLDTLSETDEPAEIQ